MTDNRRFICLSALILVGDMILRLKFTKNTTDDIVGIVAAFISAAAVTLLIKWGIQWWSKKEFRGKKALSVALMLAACVLAVWTSVYTVFSFSRYAAEVMLDMKGIFLPFVTFFGLAVAFAFADRNLLLKAALILFPLVLAFIVLMFAFSSQFMSIKYLIPYKELTLNGTFDVGLDMFTGLMTGALPIIVMGRSNKKRWFAVSYLLGLVLLAFCIVNVLAIFGGELASTLSYPYSRAVSTASMGEVFSRMDGFLYTVCFFTCLIKAGAGSFSAVYLLKTLIRKIFS